MPLLSVARGSTKIADVLQILHNPRTPESAKQRTLRRLDGLEGRHAPIPKRRSLDSDSSQGRETGRASLDSKTSAAAAARSPSVSAELETSICRLSITDGVAPLSSHDSERRFASPPPPTSPSGGRGRVMFLDEWELAGQDHSLVIPESSVRDGPRRNRQPVASTA